MIEHASVDGLGPSLEIAIAREAATDDGEIVPTLSNLVTKLPAHSTCRPQGSRLVTVDLPTGDLPTIGIGVDIGGTSTKAAFIDGLGRVIASITLPTRPGADGVVSTAMTAMLAVARTAGLSVSDVDAVAVGIPGTVDPHRGTVRYAVNGIGRDNLDLASRLTEQVGAAVHVDNDVRAAALGADWYLTTMYGAVDDLAYLSIGTGIAAGYVERGRVRRGNMLVAGEIGHIPIDPLGRRCVCGQIGCIEAMSSGSAIDRLWSTSSGSAAADGQHSEFLGSLDLGSRMRIIDPSVPLGAIGAIGAAHEAGAVSPVPLP